ncbi:MAG: EF-P lysine aminoacylase GenX [Planctomycetaceae bacterium]|jgi:lysyl-tRNA synthetase class 2|nr:EF-P lysine aminoacylase GenX [Planctomycetaceae bacterium]
MTGFLPTASIENIFYRSELLKSVRDFFDWYRFIEVQTPVLSADTVIDRYVEPIRVNDDSLPLTYRGDRNYYLQTSPEFAMKRLLSAGVEAIYQICPAFRRGDRGELHNIEFTMLEWYRVGDDYAAGMRFLSELVQSIFAAPVFQEIRSDFPTISLVRFDDIFCEHVGQSFRNLSAKDFRELADKRGICYPESYVSGGNENLWIDLFFSELVQPKLSSSIVYDYPAGQSQLARCRINENGNIVTERFELYLGGVEIANGYHELVDVAELRERLERISAEKVEDGGTKFPIESRLLKAMEHGLPPSSGTALGIDRLLLYILNAKSIDEVITFPIERC